MQKNTFYYGEIVARIAGRLYGLTDHEDKDFMLRGKDMSMVDMLCEVSADAGRIFDTLEDLSGEHYINWSEALDHYASTLKKFIQAGSMPSMADMISLAASSMDHSRQTLEKSATLL